MFPCSVPCLCHPRGIPGRGAKHRHVQIVCANNIEFYDIWRLASCQSPKGLGWANSSTGVFRARFYNYPGCSKTTGTEQLWYEYISASFAGSQKMSYSYARRELSLSVAQLTWKMVWIYKKGFWWKKGTEWCHHFSSSFSKESREIWNGTKRHATYDTKNWMRCLKNDRGSKRRFSESMTQDSHSHDVTTDCGWLVSEAA